MKFYKSNLLLLSFYINNLLILLYGYLSVFIVFLFPFFGISNKFKIKKVIFFAFIPLIIFFTFKFFIGIVEPNHLFDSIKGLSILIISYFLFTNTRINELSIKNFLILMTMLNLVLVLLHFFGFDSIGRSKESSISGLFDEPSAFGLVVAFTSLFFLKRKNYLFWTLNIFIALSINSLTGFISIFAVTVSHFILQSKRKNFHLLLIPVLCFVLFLLSSYLAVIERIYVELFMIFKDIDQIDLTTRGSSSQMRIVFEFLYLTNAISESNYFSLFFGSFEDVEYRTASLNGLVEIIFRYGFVGLFFVMYAFLYLFKSRAINLEFIICLALILFSTGAIFKLSFIFFIYLAFKASNANQQDILISLK